MMKGASFYVNICSSVIKEIISCIYFNKMIKKIEDVELVMNNIFENDNIMYQIFVKADSKLKWLNNSKALKSKIERNSCRKV